MTVGYHLSTTPEHYTPAWVIELAHQVLGGPPDLDPASCRLANEVVGAARHYSLLERGEDGLELPWWGDDIRSAIVNPPSGDRNLPRRFWARALEAAERGTVVFWVGFNANQLCTLQAAASGPLRHPTCVLRRRMRFDSVGRPGGKLSAWQEASSRSADPEEQARLAQGVQGTAAIVEATRRALLEEILAGPLCRVPGTSPVVHNFVTLLGGSEEQVSRFGALWAPHGDVTLGSALVDLEPVVDAGPLG